MSGIAISTKKSRISFGVTKLPNRKAKCLYVERGATIEPVEVWCSNADQ